MSIGAVGLHATRGPLYDLLFMYTTIFHVCSYWPARFRLHRSFLVSSIGRQLKMSITCGQASLCDSLRLWFRHLVHSYRPCCAGSAGRFVLRIYRVTPYARVLWGWQISTLAWSTDILLFTTLSFTMEVLADVCRRSWICRVLVCARHWATSKTFLLEISASMAWARLHLHRRQILSFIVARQDNSFTTLGYEGSLRCTLVSVRGDWVE